MMEIERLITLIDAVSNSELTAFEYETDTTKLRLEKEKEAPVILEKSEVRSMEVREVEQPKEKEDAQIISSPLVGTFYAAPAEDAPPYVKVGDAVKKGQVVAIVEAMKLMNEIESEYEGEIVELLVENGQAVEYGQPLMKIK